MSAMDLVGWTSAIVLSLLMVLMFVAICIGAWRTWKGTL